MSRDLVHPDLPAAAAYVVERPLRAQIAGLVADALSAAAARNGFEVDPPAEIPVERPGNPEHGDYATALALQLAKPLRRPPRAIAEALADALRTPGDGVAPSPIRDVQIAGPGFLNLRLDPAFVESALAAAVAAGDSFGRVVPVAPERINVEFVSANPTGPLTIGNARGAFAGDLLCRVLEAGGHDVTREYYFNDFGAQVRNLGLSVYAVRTGAPIPEDGYKGGYVTDLAASVPDEVWSRATAADADPGEVLGAWASEVVRAGIEASLRRLGVRFDVWKSEGSLHREGWVERAVERLRASEHIYQQDEATWFRSTAYGDDKDRVVIRSNGEPTYFAADIGYVTEKFSRGFDRLIYIWGADHHGTVARVRNAAEAMGFRKDAVEILLTAWVRFIRDGQEISMSKRSGEYVTLDELLAEIGADAARWSFGAKSANTGIDLDLELVKRESSENPVYYVQYAHARISSILRKAEEQSLRPAESFGGSLGADEVGLGLAKVLLRLPEVVEDAVRARETQGVTTFATELATRFHAYYRDRRVIDPDDPVTTAQRLALVAATRQTLANTLGLLGISAPDSM